VANIAAEMMSILFDVSEGSARELHRLDLDLESGILADLGDEIDHHALDAVGLGVEEREGARRSGSSPP